MSNDLDSKVDKLEEITDPNTVISIGGYSFTPAKLMIAAGIISSVLGGLYGAFEVYKDYQDMKSKITEYVAPDLSVFDKRLAVIEETSQKTNDYTRDIKNDLKNDLRRLEGVIEQVERSAKQSAREASESQKEQEKELRQLRKEIDSKIQKALDNPLAGK
jgi:cysteinyl-tRNA synthetase